MCFQDYLGSQSRGFHLMIKNPTCWLVENMRRWALLGTQSSYSNLCGHHANYENASQTKHRGLLGYPPANTILLMLHNTGIVTLANSKFC